jgi:hypothetical protein
LTYQISSVNNSGLVSISNPTTPIDISLQNLETIVSQDVFLTPENIALYALLELSPTKNQYNVYFQKANYPTQAPGFESTAGTLSITMLNLICLSISIMDSTNAVVSCYNNQTGQQKNYFYFYNLNGTNTLITLADWNTNWESISARKIVKFTYLPSQNIPGTFFAMITPNSAINPQNTQNLVYIYKYTSGPNLLLVTQLTNTTFNITNINFNIQDIASSGQQIFLLSPPFVWFFTIDAVQGIA